MSESDRKRDDAQSPADRTLLGVAPPKLESSPELGPRSPVFVRSGTSVAPEPELPPPLPRMALPSRSAPGLPEGKALSELPPPLTTSLSSDGAAEARASSQRERLLGAAWRHPALWMVGAPVLVAAAAALIFATSSSAPKPNQALPAASPSHAPAVAPAAVAAPGKSPQPALAELAGKAPETLTSSELVSLAESRAASRQGAAESLRAKLEAEPALAQDKAVRAELLELASDPTTARIALASMTKLAGPLGADLLYEVWTGTPARTEATELARTLVYSSDLRGKASPALAVALDLRVAETCEQNKALLPRAQADADRRALHLLTRLLAKRGCGPKKAEDCFACLRDPPDQLTASINAAKSR
ncbi:MAG TPA: hypothetical protein VIW29_17410, partial [Polyangiaceae bacterium]